MLRRIASRSMRTAVAPRARRSECGLECAGRIELNTRGLGPDHLNIDLIAQAATGVAFCVFGVGSSVSHTMPEALLAKSLWGAARPLPFSYPRKDVNNLVARIAAREVLDLQRQNRCRVRPFCAF